LVRNLSAFSTLFAPGKSWDNVRSTAALYTESRLARLVRNKRVGFPVVEQVDQGHFEQNKKWGLLINFLVFPVSALSSSRCIHVTFSH
jgi:hypothetical protein